MLFGKLCPVCKRSNLAGATHCVDCTTPLEGSSHGANTTAHLPGLQPALAGQPDVNLLRPNQLPLNALALYIMDREAPVLIQPCAKVILGRQTASTSIPTLDLMPYEVDRYGVSRQHAIVMNMLDRYTIQDLNSTNGTWVNGRRLEAGKPYPLSSGSQVRLGHFTFYTYFRLRVIPEDIVFLYEEARGSALLRPILTSGYLVNVVSPYLQALTDLQKALDETRGQEPYQISVNTISASRRESPIGVSLSGVSDAVRIVKEWIRPWRRENTGLLAAPAPVTSRTDGESTAGLPDGPDAGDSGRTRKTEPLFWEAGRLALSNKEAYPQRRLEAAIQSLAGSVLSEVLPDSGEPDWQKHLAALATPLKTLATSKLQVYVAGEDAGEA